MRVLYLMKTQDSNLGDLLINKLLIDLLAERADCMLFDVSGVSYKFREAVTADVPSPVIFSTRRDLGYYLKLLLCRKYFDVIIAPPGHAGKAGWRHVVPVVFAFYYRLLGVRYMRLGKSIPHNTGLGALLEKILVLISHHTLVRDQGSLERVRMFQNQRNISCAPDLIVLLFGKEPPATGKHGLIVSFRFDYYPEEKRPAFVKQVAELAAHYARQHSLPITLTWQVERDEACVRAVAAELNAMGLGTSLAEVTLGNLAHTYRGSSLILSNRLHVALTSLCLGANAWAVCDPTKDHKIIDAFKELKLGERLLGIDQRTDLMSDSTAPASLQSARDALRAAILASLT
ncbi:polysaccharide pyruvyl transferase family protein [Prosthecobacter sp.]|uniref:polysaccharide pyruvyl transferase family protein n=1 Tax=Prosthecobacter sp. TaxID=1965333 RepID=UPI001D854FD9|nr:polysaccharide pyruvyl transferase family protein [Prosthecobacter sp.]MCB1277598.1 polysaccharide pyruvyl transferase family protein [Prosthecobacter sp.]